MLRFVEIKEGLQARNRAARLVGNGRVQTAIQASRLMGNDGVRQAIQEGRRAGQIYRNIHVQAKIQAGLAEPETLFLMLMDAEPAPKSTSGSLLDQSTTPASERRVSDDHK